jgi:hypothetical protein
VPERRNSCASECGSRSAQSPESCRRARPKEDFCYHSGIRSTMLPISHLELLDQANARSAKPRTAAMKARNLKPKIYQRITTRNASRARGARKIDIAASWSGGTSDCCRCDDHRISAHTSPRSAPCRQSTRPLRKRAACRLIHRSVRRRGRSARLRPASSAHQKLSFGNHSAHRVRLSLRLDWRGTDRGASVAAVAGRGRSGRISCADLAPVGAR